ncbi:ketose-bisphosphate aldolase [Alkalicoccobacillus murimartini]|uniref:Fructose-bisphosphate aldolase class II n=1 Tax=Alkalicoccobacillus murimartini TaxID=171685 RepID=A0ABT9YJH9_9BACI|nr:ketose-bisphosphate aldolase [Alkalicoccobacillus murimartini]MDQ0207372.1 fructose-bisphosphate aldolase class II [Alkalicoccobacillus murimartini]
MLMNMKDLLAVAYKHQFAVGSFNVANSEFVRVIIESAEEKNAPAIIQIHPNEVELLGDDFITYVRESCRNAKVPMVIHLDHGGSVEDVMRAIRNGFTSVMIDASHASFEDNIAISKEVVKLAHSVNVSVEAELGTIGSNEGSSEGGADVILYTDVDDAKTFVEQTGIDTLAIAIGTSHGQYKHDRQPELKLDLLAEINKNVDIPLVLHGGSDNKDEEISQTYLHGVSKINLSTDMKNAFFKEMRRFLIENDTAYEPDMIMPSARKAAQEVVKKKMDLFNSTNQAHHYFS